MNKCANCNDELQEDEIDICDICFEQMPMDEFVSNWPVKKKDNRNE